VLNCFVVSVVVLPLGCAKASMTYSLQRWGKTTVIVPPNQKSTNENSGLLVVIKNARQKATPTDCDIDGLVALHWRGRAVEIKLRPESYVAERSEAAQSVGAVSGMYLDPLQDIGAFHSQLQKLESKGCLTSVEAQHIRRVVAEGFPLPPSISYRYQLGSFDTTGFFELTPDFRLEVVNPVYNSDSQTVEHQTGYEVSYYAFKAAPHDNRLTVSLTSVSEFHPSQATIPKATPTSKVHFPTKPSFFHLVFKTEKTSDRQITKAFLLSSTDDSRLDTGTKQLQAASVDTCEAVSAPGVGCVGFPPNFGVSPELRVRANGKYVFVPLDGSVMDALGMHGLNDDVQKNLRVTRLFKGRRVPIVSDPTNKDILGLTLMPGDEIRSPLRFGQMPELEALTNRLGAVLEGEDAKAVVIADFSEEAGRVTLQEVLLADRLWISLLNQQRGFTLNRDVLRKQLDKEHLSSSDFVARTEIDAAQAAGADVLITGKIERREKELVVTVTASEISTGEQIDEQVWRVPRTESLDALAKEPIQASSSFYLSGQDGVSAASCAYCPNPQYTATARKHKIEGRVWMMALIDSSGRAMDVWEVRGLPEGLTQQAMELVRQEWHFKPAHDANGRAVPIVTCLDVDFRLM